MNSIINNSRGFARMSLDPLVRWMAHAAEHPLDAGRAFKYGLMA